MNISANIINSINDTLTKLFSSIGKEIFKIMDKLIYINVDIFSNTIISKKDIVQGMQTIANIMIIACIIYYAFQALVSIHMGKEIQNVWSYIFRLIICTILMNNSIFICEQIVNIFDILTQILLSLGKNIYKKEISFEEIYKRIEIISKDKNDYLSLNGIMKGIIGFGSISLAISYAVRYVQVQLLIILSPFAFLSLVNIQTAGMFKSWFKMLITMLSLQLISIVILYIPIGMADTDDSLNKLIFIGSIYTLYKANTFIKELLTSIGAYSDMSNGMSGLKSLFR